MTWKSAAVAASKSRKWQSKRHMPIVARIKHGVKWYRMALNIGVWRKAVANKAAAVAASAALAAPSRHKQNSLQQSAATSHGGKRTSNGARK